MKQKKEKKKTAILYARLGVKPQDQKPDRLQHQIDELIIYCQDNKIKVEKIYSEVGSGQSFDRAEFQKMLKDLKSKKVKAGLLLFTTWDRFSRNLGITDQMVSKLKKLGVKTLSVKEEIESKDFLSIINQMMKQK